jgi:stalled ribosome rescue protein Dom34
MNKIKAGIWIDHRDATIVVLTEVGEETTEMQSSVEKQLRRSGEPSVGAFEAQLVPADDSRERAYTEHMIGYYDKIVSHLSDARRILILGPGEAKDELRKHFEKLRGETQEIVVETAEQMTKPQLIARVRLHFHQDAARLL